jgi:peroxiredoxin (alkyl hydroperoxide reductase subunit C)
MINELYNIPQNMIGRTLPECIATTVMPDNKIDESFCFNTYAKHNVGLLFFYPLDFTFVCPSELIALDAKMSEFEQRDVMVTAISVDSQYSHLAYKNTPRDKGGIGQVKFPIMSDLNRKISSKMGVLHNESVALRATIIVDKKGLVRHYSLNDLPLGRNIDEIIRIIDAIDHNAKHGEVCPANWTQGKPAMTPTAEGVAHYIREHT